MDIPAAVREEIELYIAIDQLKLATSWLQAETDRLDRQNSQGPEAAALLDELAKTTHVNKTRLLELLNSATLRLSPLWIEARLDTPPPSNAVAIGAAKLPENRHPLDAQTEKWGRVRDSLAKQRDSVLRESQAFAVQYQTLVGWWGTLKRWFPSALLLLLFWCVACFAHLRWIRQKYARSELSSLFAWILAGTAGLTVLPLLSVELFLMRVDPTVEMSEASLPPAPLAPQQIENLRSDELRARQQLELAEAKYLAARTKWEETATTHLSGSPNSEQWLNNWSNLRQAAREAAVHSGLLQQISLYIDRDSREETHLASLRATLGNHVSQKNAAWWLCSLGLAAAHGSVLLLMFLHRYLPRLWPSRFAVCPCCYAKGSLRSDNNRESYKCNATILTKTACQFQTKQSDLCTTSLCFPTLGSPSSGKTIWLLGLHETLDKSLYDHEKVVFSLKEGGCLKDIVGKKSIVESKGLSGVPATTGVPAPLTIEYHRWNETASKCLLTVFDYPGEKRDFDDPIRRRQLQANGILLFLDITNNNLDDQLKIIDTYLEHAGSKTAKIPLAICLSKMDILEGSRHGGPSGTPATGLRDNFDKSILTHDPTSLCWTELNERSEFCLKYFKAIGIEIEGKVRKLGTNYKFFPMSAGGTKRLDPDHPTLPRSGVKGPLYPELVLAPLLWLLTLNGTPTLDSFRAPD
jgi:hypothetical protein